MENYRVRFAPSPTGPLHIGGARSALFNYLLAKKHNGTFIVRIEDTDLERSSKESEENIKDSLKWLGITWDEGIDVGGKHGPYRQTERLEIYRDAVNRLLKEGKAYPCYCTEKELEAEKAEQTARGEVPRYSGKCRCLTPEQRKAKEAQGIKPVIRFRVPEHQEVVVNDLVRGDVSFDSDGIGDFIIVKSDGIPVYNFAVVMDDVTMGITHIIRGEEHLSNTPRQLVIYDALGYEKPKFAHVSLILGKDRTKMSKRHGSTSVVAYKEQGFLPEAIVNFLALLGWAPGGEEEIFTLDELVDRFSLDRVSKSPAVFDLEKLKWLNGAYIRKASHERLMEYGVPFLQKAGLLPENPSEDQLAQAGMIIEGLKNHLSCFGDLPDLVAKYQGEVTLDEAAKKELAELGETSITVCTAMSKKLGEIETLTDEAFRKAIKATQKETGIKGRPLYHSLRAVLTGTLEGPDLDKVAVIIGLPRIQELLSDFCSPSL